MSLFPKKVEYPFKHLNPNRAFVVVVVVGQAV